MERSKSIIYWLGLAVLIIGMGLIFPTVIQAAEPADEAYTEFTEVETQEVYVRGEVVRILGEEELADALDWEMNQGMIMQIVEVSLADPYAGQKVTVEHTASKTNPVLGSNLTAGDKVIVFANVDSQDQIVEAFIANPDRSGTVKAVVLAFMAVLIILGGRKGIGALFTIVLTGVLLWFWLIPSILNGASPTWCGALVCAVVALVGTPMISGFNRTSMAAIFGSIAGVILAGVLASLAGGSADIIGVDYEDANLLLSMPATANLNLQGIFLAGVLIGALGAVMDTSISIASAIREFAEIHGSPTRYNLWRAGMNVGKDVMGMMSSTLILAYTGGALALLLLLVANNIPALNIMNWDMIVSEIIRSLAGSIGLCLSIPVTALAASYLVGKKTEEG